VTKRRAAVSCVVGLLLGAAAGVGTGWYLWRHAADTLAQRLDTTMAQVQGERDRLRHELDDIARERHEMADAAEHLRAQVERQQERLEGLARELAEPEIGGDSTDERGSDGRGPDGGADDRGSDGKGEPAPGVAP